MKDTTFLERFEDYVTRHELFTHQQKILLTVSGGVDSMVMLSLFVRCGYTVGVAHCNFQLRGAESDEDEQLVAEECRKLGVECYNRRFDTAAEVERTGDSVEMAARNLRYAWFHELCEQYGYDVISVAHHVDDSIETFFINLLRGTGLKGLTGINSQIGRVVRPLMFSSRKEILEYAISNHIPFREDSTNRSTKYLRNKIRLRLVPMIREINCKFTSLMRGNFYRLMDAQRFINHGIDRIKADALTEQNGIYTIHTDRIDRDFPMNFVIYEILNSSFGFKGDIVDELCKALEHGLTGKRFYSKSFVACIDRGNIEVTHITPDDACTVVVERYTQRSYCGNSVLFYEYLDIDTLTELNVAENTALIDADKLTFPLTLRRWHEGDWFVPLGMSGRKKVSDYLIDHKLSMIDKSRQFVLLSGQNIVWLVGLRLDDRYRVNSATENVLRITRDVI